MKKFEKNPTWALVSVPDTETRFLSHTTIVMNLTTGEFLTPYNIYAQTRAIAMVSNRCLDLALAQNRWFQTHCKLFAWPLTVTFSTISRKSYTDRYHHICKNFRVLKFYIYLSLFLYNRPYWNNIPNSIHQWNFAQNIKLKANLCNVTSFSDCYMLQLPSLETKKYVDQDLHLFAWVLTWFEFQLKGDHQTFLIFIK